MKKIILILIAFSISLFAITKEQIKDEFYTKSNQTLSVLADKTIDENKKIETIYSILDPLFDYKKMAEISLGKHFANLKKDEQDEFSRLFEKNLKNSYTGKIKDYSGENINIVKTDDSKKNRYFLFGNIVSNGKTHDFLFKFYDAKERGWLIYDIDIIGVSIIQTYRSQFDDILKNSDFKTLLEKLKEK